jgi:hypothetical protein
LHAISLFLSKRLFFGMWVVGCGLFVGRVNDPTNN